MKEDKVHIVYPYRMPADVKNDGWELRISLRSLYENFKDDFDITIIGDIPNWINRKEVNCIEFNNHEIKAQRQTKINQKILKATELFGEFLVFNDDIIVMKETNLDFFKEPIGVGVKKLMNFKEESFEDTPRNSFKKQVMNTYFKLKGLGFQCNQNFVSHCPHFYTTKGIKEVEKYFDFAPISDVSVVFENLYFNFHGKKGRASGPIRYGCWGKGCPDYSQELLFNFDENGASFNPWIEEFLRGKFNKKCKAEK